MKEPKNKGTKAKRKTTRRSDRGGSIIVIRPVARHGDAKRQRVAATRRRTKIRHCRKFRQRDACCRPAETTWTPLGEQRDELNRAVVSRFPSESARPRARVRAIIRPSRFFPENFAQIHTQDDDYQAMSMKKKSNTAAEGMASSLRPGVRFAISAGLLFHLVAVIACPLAVPPRSPLNETIFRGVQWYAEPLFLNHGYRFFAPNPGPSILVRYEIETHDGKTIRGVTPNLETQWPRLLYHRHFMLTSRLQGTAGPPSPNPADASTPPNPQAARAELEVAYGQMAPLLRRARQEDLAAQKNDRNEQYQRLKDSLGGREGWFAFRADIDRFVQAFRALPPGPETARYGEDVTWLKGFVEYSKPIFLPMETAYADSYARHLYARHDARRVRLFLVQHLLPSPAQVRDGVKLDDKRLYRQWPLVEYAGEQG